MATVAELMVKISGENSGLRKELDASKRQLTRFQKDMPDFIPNGAGAVMAAMGAGMAAMGVSAVKLASSMETNRLAFETMLGSGEKAKTLLENLAKFSEQTPFEFDSLVNSSKKMLGLGVAAEQILPQLKVVGDAVASVGGNSESVDAITNAFAKMQAAGFISAEQMNRLTDAGIPGWQLLAKTLSDAAGQTISVGEAMKMAETKSIDATTSISGMMTEMSTRYGGAMDKISGTNAGIWSNIHDTAVGVMRNIGDQLNTSLDVKNNLNTILGDLTAFKSNVQTMGLGQAIKDEIPAGALSVSLGAMAAAITTRVIPAMASMTIAIQGLGLAAGPVGWLITSVGALTTLVTYTGVQYEKTGGAVAATNAVIFDGVGRMNLAGDAAGNLAGKLDGVYSSAIQAAKSMAVFNQATGDIAGGQKSHIPYASSLPETSFTPPGANIGNAAAEMKKLEADAKRASQSIKEEWVQTTKTQLQQLDIWKDEQLKSLDETASANENYEDDKLKVAAVYSARRTKILQQDAQDATDTCKSIRDGYENIQRSMSGLTGSSKGITDINSKYDNKSKSTKDFFDKQSQDFKNADDAQKKTILSSLDQMGVAYQIAEDGRLDLSKATSDAIAAYTNQKYKETTDYYASCKDIQADIDEAYATNSMSALQASLTEQNAVRMNDYAAQQSMMKTYQEAFLAAHSTTAQLMADLYDGAFTGLSNSLSNIFTMTESVGDAFKSLGQSLWQIIADHYAQQIAGMITVGLFGQQEDKKKIAGATSTAAATTAAYTAATAAATAHYTAKTAAATASETALTALAATSLATTSALSIAAAAVMAAAWAPAAAMVSLASFGANSVPAMAGIAATTAMSYSLAVPMLASGGITTGPTMAMIGEGRYQEAVLPLNKRMFEKMGLTNGEPQGQPAGDQYHISITTPDAKAVKKLFMENGSALVDALRSQNKAFVGV